MTEATTCTPRPALLRCRNTNLFCVQCHLSEEDAPNQKLLRCSRCKLVYYCTPECQKEHFKAHKKDCKILHTINNGSHAPSIAKGNFILEMGYKYTDTMEHGAHIYEQALDQYLECFDLTRHRSEGRGGGFVPLRIRIPFLLAALGHDELAMAEVSNSMGPYLGMGNEPTPKSVYDDLIKEAMPEIPFTSWPACFMLPVLFVKMRLVFSLRAQAERFDAFTDTSDCQFMDSAKSVVSEFVSGDPNVLADQERQLNFLGFLLTRNKVLNSIVEVVPLTQKDALCEELFDGGDDNEPAALYRLLQDCFLENAQMHSWLKETVSNPTYLHENWRAIFQ
jgi:hypothetical protein